MRQPIQNIVDFGKNPACRQRRPVDQNDRNPQGSSRFQLGIRAAATGILGNDQADPIGLQKCEIVRFVKGAAREDQRYVGQGQGGCRRIHQAQQIPVLGPRGEIRQRLLADRQEDAGGVVRQRSDSPRRIGNRAPVIARPDHPRRALERADRGSGQGACGKGIAAHASSERMSGVNHMGDPFGAQIGRQPVDSAEPAHTGRQGLRHRAFRAPGIREDRIDPCVGQAAGQRRRLGRAAEQKDARHV